MKNINRIYIVFFLIFASQTIFAQQIGNLDGIYYQAVAIDETGREIVGTDINGKPVYEKTIGIQFTITSGVEGDVLYQETHSVLTDSYGLFSIVIGYGTQTEAGLYDSLMAIPWIDADQFLSVEIAINNDGVYKLVSKQKFMSVPYSFYTDDIADDAITSAKILNETILAEDIGTGSVTSSEILDATILNEDIADGTIDLTTKVTGILPVENGGTGVATLPEGGILIGGGETPVTSLGQATDGQIPIGITGGDPVLANITAGTGIEVVNTSGGIIINSTISGGVNSNGNASINVGNIAAGETWQSGAFVLQQPPELDPIEMGDILIGSADVDMEGCMMNVYLTDVNASVAHARIAIFNGTGAAINLGNGIDIKILVVK